MHEHLYRHPYPSRELEAEHPFVELGHQRLSVAEMERRAESFHELLARRRSVRLFSPDPVPDDLIAKAVLSAATAPSGLTNSRGGSLPPRASRSRRRSERRPRRKSGSTISRTE